jgi:hypothetical protein
MTKEEAWIIFKSWQEYMEIADKFDKLMLPVPTSFLPYPYETLEEALNIVAKDYFDSGDIERSKIIQSTIAAYLWSVKSDEEAITQMKKTIDLIEQNPELKKTLLKSLKECQDSWIKSRNK